jgi:hypothetical protein
MVRRANQSKAQEVWMELLEEMVAKERREKRFDFLKNSADSFV